MLEVGGGEMQGEVSETGNEVEMFVQALQEGRASANEDEWLSLSDMMSEYDVPLFQGVLLANAWNKHIDYPLFAYAAGALLGCNSLQQLAARASIRLGSIDPLSVRCCKLFYIDIKCKKSHANQTPAASVWNLARDYTSAQLKPSGDPVQIMTREFQLITHEKALCQRCLNFLYQKRNELGRKWSRAKDDPVYLMDQV
ncbi:hypothetical protein JCM8547_008544 [Rhodosporidiobolus lusitaniae]